MRVPFFAALLPLLAVACAPEDEPATDGHDHDDHMDMPLDVALRFAPDFDGAPVGCDSEFAAPMGSSTVSFSDFRLFVSEVALVTADGTEVPVDLEQDGKWQFEQVALLDFEDGSGSCAATGNTDLNDQVLGTVPAGEYTGLAFTVGVPFEHNHQDPTVAEAPLNNASMFWNWQGGYKFVRIDMHNDLPAPDDGWFFHLGSTGCEADAPVDVPVAECTKPNRPRIVLDGFDLQASEVRLDVASLLAGVDLGANVDQSPPGCMSNPVEPADCAAIFTNLGLSVDTGECVDSCSSQQLFVVQ